MSSYLRLSPQQLQQGYLKLNGIVAERQGSTTPIPWVRPERWRPDA